MVNFRDQKSVEQLLALRERCLKNKIKTKKADQLIKENDRRVSREKK